MSVWLHCEAFLLNRKRVEMEDGEGKTERHLKYTHKSLSLSSCCDKIPWKTEWKWKGWLGLLLRVMVYHLADRNHCGNMEKTRHPRVKSREWGSIFPNLIQIMTQSREWCHWLSGWVFTHWLTQLEQSPQTCPQRHAQTLKFICDSGRVYSPVYLQKSLLSMTLDPYNED